MKKWIFLSLALTAMFAVAGEGPSTLEEAHKLAKESGKPVLVDFYYES